MSAIELIIERLESHGCAPHQNGRGLIANCPCCGDTKGHLGIKVGDDGRVLLNDLKGCSPQAIVSKIGLTMADLFERKDIAPQTVAGPIEHLAYIRGWNVSAMLAIGAKAEGPTVCIPMKDSAGKQTGDKLRRGDGKPIKTQEGETKSWTRKGSKNGLIYPMPFPAEGRVDVCEGEADVIAGINAGGIAVVGTPGAHMSRFVRSELQKLVAGRDVVMFPHPDKDGCKWRESVGDALRNAGCSVSFVPALDGDLDDRLRGKSDKAAVLRDLVAGVVPFVNGSTCSANISDLAEKREIFPLTDTGNAQRFKKTYGAEVLYVPNWKKWMWFDNSRWVHDDKLLTEALARDVIHAIPAEAEGCDPDLYASILRWAATSESDHRRKALLSCAQCELAITPDDLDPEDTAYLFNVTNGTIDLRTGKLLPHDRRQHITRCSPSIYDTTAECPTWLKFLNRVFANDLDLIAFIQQAIGCSMIGAVLAKIFFILWGDGDNGKTVFREAVSDVFGDYAKTASVQLFMETRNGDVPHGLAGLKGVRLLSASETQEGNRLSAPLIKNVTGGDTIEARYLYSEPFNFQAVFTPWLATNHKPIIPDGGDKALWERLRLIPFTVSIPKSEQIPLADMLASLRAERSGILNWFVRGALMFQEAGCKFNPPTVVLSATADYRQEQDTLADFVEDCCVIGRDVEVERGALYRAYVVWNENQKSRPLTQVGFTRRLTAQGIETRRDHSLGRVWSGIGLKA